MSRGEVIKVLIFTLGVITITACIPDAERDYKEKAREQLKACGHNYSAEYMNLLSSEGVATLLTNSRCDGGGKK